MTTDLARYDEQGDTPLTRYAGLAGTFTAGVAAFAAVARRRGVRLPARVPLADVALLGAATFKASRLLTRDKILSPVRAPFTRRRSEGPGGEVMDEARGHGVRHAIGDLVSCPFCSAVWAGGALMCCYVAVPRATRVVCAGLGAITMADWLHYAWSWTQESAEG